MSLAPATVLRGQQVELRPIEAADAGVLREIHSTPEVAAWWGLPSDGFPFADDPEATRFAIVAAGEVAGLIQFGEEPDPDYRHAWIDVFLAPDRHGRGLGTDALVTLVRHLTRARGHHRITIDPATDNAPAIRCYEKAGFRPVGVMHAAWRDSLTQRWRDALLMELVVEPPGARS